jgi:predicted transcriptional regulator
VSGRIVGEVLDHAPDLPETEWRVLIALAEDANDRDRIARYSSTERLSERVRRARGSVHNALSNLAAKGIIRPLLKAHRGRIQHYEIARLSADHRFVTYDPKASQPGVNHSHPRKAHSQT